MKLPFTNQVGDDVRSLISNPLADERFEPRDLGSYGVVSRRGRAAGNRKSAIANRQSRSGIALVITLILLSVTLVMAVAFLAISNRERSSVTTTTDATTARLAAETALAQAESQILSQMLATTNPYTYGLIVSTNYINPNGFNTGEADPRNVNYDFRSDAQPYTTADLEQNIANLFLSPRVPVFITTNQSSGATDFRFYLDLNRNGVFDTNGNVPSVDNFGVTNGPPVLEVGDPEWIGVLERPDTAHGPNNKFLSRFAFFAQPIGNALDVNYIHNQALTKSVANINNDGFLRNQGVGSWEINLAAFLADLNTNEWDNPSSGNFYQYLQPAFANSGAAFNDAFSLLSYRYNGSYNSLASVNGIYPNGIVFQNDNIDEYSDGPLQTSTTNINEFFNQDNPNLSWVGADNINHFFTLGDLFDTTKIAPANFINHLQQAGTNISTYDRYTYYRMLSQLGTDSTPESGLMNVNYDNLDLGFNGALNVSGTASVTNFVPWTPIGFFTNAADRMLRLYSTNWFYASLTKDTNDFTTNNYLATYYGIIYTNPISSDQFGNVYGMTNYIVGTNQVPAFGFANIPVLVNGQFVYSPAVNRLLQLAANMYDATTNRYYASDFSMAMPTVFKPVFSVLDSSNVYITNFVEVLDTNFFTVDPILNINYGPTAVATLKLNPNALVFGVPLIIGAKKGFPNFNEFYMENTFQLTRKLLVTRLSTNVPVPVPANFFSYYEQFSLSLTNQFGVEMWNSYRSNYTRSTDIYVNNFVTTTLTNDEGSFSFFNGTTASGYLHFDSTTPWPGYNTFSSASSFQIPLATNFPAVPSSIYNLATFSLYTNLAVPFQTNYASIVGQYPQPHWGMTITNNLQVIMVDSTTHRLIDYVQLSGPNTNRDLTAEIQNDYDKAAVDTGYNNLWNTNLSAGGVPIGVTEQLKISQGGGNPVYSSTLWGQSQKTAYDQINAFRIFTLGKSTFLLNYPGYVIDPTKMAIAGSTNAIQAAYTPTATVVQDITWQANDPLVHYLASDLINPSAGNGLGININWPGNLGKLNQRYMPWGGNPLLPLEDTNAYAFALKDPLVYSSDYWDFPTYKLPTVGWLGHVHRGTPWQTVYLKASNILKTTGINTWINRTGNVNPFDATNTAPLQDRLLFDLFTTAPNDNATRGQLSVNVGAVQGGYNLAAWSALFSGMVVPPTSPTNNFNVISPAGMTYTNSPLGQLVLGINATRGVYTNTDGVAGVFEHKGDILATPQLTEQSPFLDFTKTNYNSDEMYEWLPQQAMSLLRASSAPRYVIYCYGQALKPAPNGIVTSSFTLPSGLNPFGMVTNYQVVTESAVRAVIRVEGANTPSPHIVVESINRLPPD
jgi:hypothetical protein